MLTYYTGNPGKMGEKTNENDRILESHPPRIAVQSLIVTRSGGIQITNIRCRGKLRGGVIARGAAIAVKNLVNFTTNLLTKFTTNFARRVARGLFRALVGRAVRGGRHALLRVGESDGEGGIG